MGTGGGTRSGGPRRGPRRVDRCTAPPPAPSPVIIAAAPVALPIAGTRRAVALIGGLMEVCGHESHFRESSFLYFSGGRGGAGGRGGLVDARRMAGDEIIMSCCLSPCFCCKCCCKTSDLSLHVETFVQHLIEIKHQFPHGTLPS